MASKSASDRPNRRLRSVAAVLFGGLIGALLALLLGPPAQRLLFDGWQRLAPRTIAPDRVSLILIDPKSLAIVGGWPWPRYYLARLVEEVAAQKPKAIAFDMIFPESDRLNPDSFAALYPELPDEAKRRFGDLPSMDGLFAQTIGAAPVVLGRLGIDGDGVDPNNLLVDSLVEGEAPAAAPHYPQVLTSIPALDDVAFSHALLNGPPDSDGVVRSVPLVTVAGPHAMPGIALELARIASGGKALRWTGRGVAMDGRTIPSDRTGALRLRFGRVPDSAVVSAARVIGGDVPPDRFTGKVVLIGLAAEGSADLVSTPLVNQGYGVFVQAQAVDAILEGGWLQRPPWMLALEWALGALLVALTALAAISRRWWLAVAGLVGLALPVASWIAFDRSNLLFDPLRPLFMLAGAALALQTLLFVRARAERERLAAALVEQRVASARQDGELQAARTIQLGMVPGPDKLAKLDRRVEVAGELDPARSVGGDFYDASMVEGDRLLLVIGDVTGKGIPAALYMALSKGLAKSVLARADGDLAEAVAALNRELLRDADESMGVTMLIAVLDCASGALSMVNAGHENPILRTAGGETRVVPMKGGPPFCVVDFPYQAESAQLDPGDTIVFVTDGVTEAENANGAFFGVAGAIDAVAETAGQDAAATARTLLVRVRAFEGETDPSDDLTVLCVRRAGDSA